MTGIKIPVSADFDGADIEKTIAKLNEQINRLGQTVAAVNKMKFTPVAQGSVSELKQVEDRYKELLKVSKAFADRVKATGQGGRGFSEVDWDRLYPDPVQRQRKVLQAFQHATAGTSYERALVAPPAPSPSGTRPGGGSHPAPEPAPAPAPASPSGPTVGSTLGGVAAAGLRATGPVGGVVANAGAAGMAGGLGAGLMGLVGGLAAIGVGKLTGGVKDKVAAAGQEGIGYDTLKRTLGDVNVSFGLLRESLRSASYDIDTTFEDTQRLGTDFAKLSGMTREQSKTLADEVAVGGGFGRSFGMDPDQSNQFFAQMRQFRVTENVNDSKRLALMIGEAVSKTGQFGKADEVLQALSGFAATQTRNGLAGANVQGFAGQMAGFMASKVPGLDVQGSAALLSRVNGAIMGGGAAGEAGQNYLFSALGRKYGLDPVQTALLQQQGAFGTGRQAFGVKDDGSPGLFQQFTKKFGGGVSGAAATSNETNLSTILTKVQKDYGSNPSLMLNATARLLGINENQAMALHTIAPQSVGGMTNRMGRLGLDLGSLSATGISALSSIEGGDRTALLGQADALRKSRKSLSVDESKRLQTAIDGGDTEKLRDILTELTYSREQEQTEGSKTRESILGVDKRLQELATHLVPAMNDMRNALVLMAGGGKMGATGIAEAVMRAESKEKVDNLNAKNEKAVQEQQAIIKKVGVNMATGEIGEENERFRKRMLDPKLSNEDREREVQVHKVKIEELHQRRKAAQERILELRTELQKATDAEVTKLEKDVKELKVNAATSPGAGGGTVSKATKQAFEQQYGEAAKKAGAALGVDPKFVLAQWGLETGWGKSVIPGTNNLGNIKDFSGGGVAAKDNATGSVDKYRVFGSTDEYVDHYVGLMKRKYKGSVGAGTDGKQFTDGLQGYAEDPDYSDKILRSSQGLFATPMPEGAPKQQPKPTSHNVDISGQVTFVTPSGQRVADPLAIKQRVSLPSAG